MKQLFTVLIIALISATTYGQGQVYTAPYTFANTLAAKSKFTYSGASIIGASEVASTHAYTLVGTSPLCKITTTRLDTIKLKTANYTSGQVFRFLTTLSTNDSTCFIPTSGSIMGGAYYWFTGAAGTYKTTSLYFDGTNYYVIK